MAAQRRLQVILRIYRSRRDSQQLAVVAARDHHINTVFERNLLAEKRESLICELRNLNDARRLDVGRALNLQRHAEQFGQKIKASESAVIAAAERVESCLVELLKADQVVRAIERLMERQAEAQELNQEKSADRDFDDVVATQFWQASYR